MRATFSSGRTRQLEGTKFACFSEPLYIDLLIGFVSLFSVVIQLSKRTRVLVCRTLKCCVLVGFQLSSEIFYDGDNGLRDFSLLVMATSLSSDRQKDGEPGHSQSGPTVLCLSQQCSRRWWQRLSILPMGRRFFHYYRRLHVFLKSRSYSRFSHQLLHPRTKRSH